jgi:hypothetical protein
MSAHPSQPPPGHGRPRVCDFCAATPAAWRYPAHPDQLTTVPIGEALVILPGGDWHACPICHHLVQAGNWEALSDRARLRHDQGAALWASFQAGRAGPPTPLHPNSDNGHQDGSASR